MLRLGSDRRAHESEAIPEDGRESGPAQMVSPMEAKGIDVEAGKARDQGVERFAH